MLDVEAWTAPEHRCSDFILDCLERGELSTSDRALLEAHLAQSPPCAARRQVLQQAHQRYAAQARPLVFDVDATPAAADGGSVGRTNHSNRRALWAASASSVLAAAAAVVLLVRPVDDEAVRTKGAATTETQFFALHHGQVQAVTSTVATGAVVRARVHSARAVAVAIFEHDATGALAPLLPSAGGLVPVAAQATVELPEARELDDVVGAADWLTLVCDDVAAVRDVADPVLVEGLRRGTVPPSCVVVHHAVQRVAR